AIQDFTDNIFAAHRIDPQFNEAIAEEHAGSCSQFAGEIGETRRNASRGAWDIPRSDRDQRAGLQEHRLMALELASADLGALQILQDANCASFPLSGAAQALDVLGVLFVSSMGKIQPRNV